MDHTHAVVKRLGFAQVPLVCVMIRYLKEAARYLMDLTKGEGDTNHVLYSIAIACTRSSRSVQVVSALIIYMVFLGLKTLLGFIVAKMAHNIIYNPPPLAPSKRISSSGAEEKVHKVKE
jgi:hypothetical protein